WDGLDYNGNPANSGQYNVYFSAESPTGATVFVDTEVSGTVTALEQGDGETFFRLSDGRKISFSDIKKVIQPVVAEE
ncbi:MAG: flagellar hook assembly protein FlgD, partial [Proteobacteria bacterium]|nr:flagellar hook assembly protein FlgD [Pseudomonadota bacterium]